MKINTIISLNEFWLPQFLLSRFLLSRLMLTLVLLASLTACDDHHPDHADSTGSHQQTAEKEPEKGPHHGRLLKDGDFTLEMSIFEKGVPPEFRVYATKNGQTLSPHEIELNVQLIRLGAKIDDINFSPFGDSMRGDTTLYEPHSFIVKVKATHQNKTYQWEYDNFEGRTLIEATVANALDIKTMISGPANLQETITVYGKINLNSENLRKIHARFEGEIQSVIPSIGDTVIKGQKLATIESNESLKRYDIIAPIHGVITQRNANIGEQTNTRQLFTITDTSSVWVDLSVYPNHRSKIKIGAPVSIIDISGQTSSGNISRIDIAAQHNQSVIARVVLNNKQKRFLPGSFVTAQVEIAKYPVALAVKRSGLQSFRDFTVVYAQIGEEYEVRMLELGRQTGEWAEVLSGLEAGTRYVSENSYVIKADIEKSGASHDH